tara:strand:+ start:112 stop:462 length:351 start_codon:yes stop_codon:yes gene_type:complete
MKIKVLKSKIHNATVTCHNINYDGSIGIDAELIEAGNFKKFEKVHVLNIDNGQRLETYIIEEARGSGKICIYGAAAHLIQKGQKIIILSYASINIEQSSSHTPTVVHLNQSNQVKN